MDTTGGRRGPHTPCLGNAEGDTAPSQSQRLLAVSRPPTTRRARDTGIQISQPSLTSTVQRAATTSAPATRAGSGLSLCFMPVLLFMVTTASLAPPPGTD